MHTLSENKQFLIVQYNLKYLIMILNRCQKILTLANGSLSILHQKAYFSTQNNQDKGSQQDTEESKNKVRMKIGSKHPTEKLLQRKIANKLKTYSIIKDQQSIFQQAKQFYQSNKDNNFPQKIIKKAASQVQFKTGFANFQKKHFSGKDKEKDQKGQKSQKNQKGENKEQQKSAKNLGYIMRISLITFLLYFLFDGSNQKADEHDRKMVTDLVQQIEKRPQKARVTVYRLGYKDIMVSCQFQGYKNKHEAMISSQADLVSFLQRIEKLKNGTVQVKFIASPETFKAKNYVRIIINLSIVAGILYIIWITKSLRSQRGSMNIGDLINSKKFEPVSPENVKISFKQVAGMHEAKFQITQFVDFLKKPEKYIQMGAKVPKGALLTGPPGTGKTLLAKACAGEAGVPFFSVSGSDFVEKYSGLGASRVRNLFEQAEKVAPSIIFIDQIDAIGKKRDSGPFSNEQRDNTLNQLLVKMDGFDTKNKVIVMAATNRKDMLDPALLRPGRFDRSVQIGLPNFQERAQILRVHLKKVKYEQNMTEEQLSKKIARITPGFSGAQLANTCNQAAILAAREKRSHISLSNFEKATERVMAGLEKRNMFTPEQKEMLAFYEAGKAVGNWFTQGADPVIKISILPFSKSKTGYSHSIKDETALNTKQQLLAKICCYLAGRSAEQYFKGYITTNGNKDLERAKKIIFMIVTKFGMSDSLKMHAFPDFDFIRKPYSEKTESLIDFEVNKIMEQCQKRVQEIIKSKGDLILKLKQKLLQKQTLTHNEIKQILGDRPFGGSQNYRDFLKDQQEQEQPKGMQGPGAGVATG